ncbi:MAG: ribosomal L7Ae/L30e/S12e/Gadd45 family protein [Candidatus Woesearchaeota archaeon]
MADETNRIREMLKENRLVIGSRAVLRELNKGNLEQIFLAANPAQKIEKDLTARANAAGCPIQKLTIPNDELGILCKKQFSISALGVRKA